MLILYNQYFIKLKIILVVSLFFICLACKAQENSTPDSSNYEKYVLSMPSFSIYGDSYFMTGVTLNEKISRQTSDVRFQLGLKQRLTNLKLPWQTLLYFTFRQKTFWDIYRKSYPFRESNYNPGIGLAKYFVNDKGITGFLFLQYEHESNGRDGTSSRTWNYLSLNYVKLIHQHFQFRIKGWAPVYNLNDNPDLFDYRGFFNAGVTYFPTKKLIFELDFSKSFTNDWRGFVQFTSSFRISKYSNQYLCLHYYGGYAENLLEYRTNVSKLRIGIAFKDIMNGFRN